MVKQFLPILILCLFFSCKKDDDSFIADTDPDLQVSEVETIIPTGDEQYLNLDSDYIFDQAKLPTFELSIPSASLARIDSDPSAEEYVEGSLTFEGETLSPIGIRYKGSIGAFVNCLSGNDWANPSGHKTCTKLSMKIKINWEGTDNRFYGLKKLQLHSQNLDDSQMRDRLGYYLFREMGVPAPRAIHARLIINGKYSGLYALIEQIDGRFSRYHFDDGTGNIYKEIWPLNSNGFPHAEQAYINELETNEDENPSAALIRTFAQEVVEANTNTIQSVISKYMNLDEIIAYAVVDRTIRHDDGPFHWYCNGGSCSNHNYFWYEEPTQQTLHLIPWDLDNAFENIIFNTNPVTPIADDWGETSAGCAPFSYGSFSLKQRSAACDPLIAAWASFEEEYEALKTVLVEGPLSEANTNMVLNTWIEQIRAATAEANEQHNDAITISQWESAVNTLKSQLNYARNN